MQYKRLGNTGLLVSELCLGTMVFGEQSARGADEKTSQRIIHRFLEAGGNFIDCANVYAGGVSEEITGRALKGRRQDCILATKVFFPMGKKGPNDRGLSRKHILDAIEGSLRRLDTDYIDLYYAHCWDVLTPLEESLRTFDDLVTAGKVRYIGFSNFSAWQAMKALATSDSHGWARFVAAQMQYSLVVRHIEFEFTPLCLDQGIGLIPWGPLGGGFLSGKYSPGDKPKEGRLAVQDDRGEEAWHRRDTERNWRILEAVGEIARARGKSHSQVALAWLLAQPAVTAPIIGARTEEQLEDNLGAVGWELSEEELKRLDEVSALPETYPYRFIRDIGAR